LVFQCTYNLYEITYFFVHKIRTEILKSDRMQEIKTKGLTVSSICLPKIVVKLSADMLQAQTVGSKNRAKHEK
jgi:hypothetical protein